MALVDVWKDKVDGVDKIRASDINSVAQAVIEEEATRNNEDLQLQFKINDLQTGYDDIAQEIHSVAQAVIESEKGKNKIVIAPYSADPEYVKRADVVLTETDGEANAQAINAVIDRLTNEHNGGEVVFYSGNVALASTIYIHDNIILNGNGVTFYDNRPDNYVTELFSIGNNCMFNKATIIRSDSFDSDPPLTLDISGENSIIQNCIFEFQGALDTQHIEIRGAGTILRECVINANSGLLVYCVAAHCTISDNQMTGLGGMYMFGQRAKITGNSFIINSDFEAINVSANECIVANNFMYSMASTQQFDRPVVEISGIDCCFTSNIIKRQTKILNQEALDVLFAGNVISGNNIDGATNIAEGNSTYPTTAEVKALTANVGNIISGTYTGTAVAGGSEMFLSVPKIPQMAIIHGSSEICIVHFDDSIVDADTMIVCKSIYALSASAASFNQGIIAASWYSDGRLWWGPVVPGGGMNADGTTYNFTIIY